MSWLFSLVLRGATLGSRFILVFYLAKYFSLEDLGFYSLFSAAVSYSLFIVGFDFYTYSTRDMLSKKTAFWPLILRDQFIFYFFSYIAIFPFLLFFFTTGLLPWDFIGWFYCILVLEHLAQEIMRIFVISGKPIFANFLLFIRSAMWIYIAVVVMFFHPSLNDIYTIFISWGGGVLLSLIFCVRYLVSIAWSKMLIFPVNWRWLKEGVRIAIPLLIATLSLRALFVFDKYILQWLDGLRFVGIYAFYISLSSALISFVDAAVIAQYYPKIVASFKNNRIEQFNIELKKFFWSILKLGSAVSILLVCFAPILFTHLGKVEFKLEIFSFYVLLLSAFIYCLGLIPHYALYAQGKDKLLIYSSIFSMIFGLFFMILLGFFLGMLGVALGQLISFSFLSLSKYYLFKTGFFICNEKY